MAGLVAVCCVLGAGLASAGQPDELDQSFGVEGVATSRGAAVTDLASDLDRGKMIAAVRGLDDGYLFGVARFKPDGSLDENFGRSGTTVVRGLSFQAQGIGEQRDGRIVAVGYKEGRIECCLGRAMVVVRLHRDGALDRSFGEGGRVVSRQSYFTGSGRALYDVAFQRDGRIVAVGARNEIQGGGRPAGLVIAFRPDGRVDRSFGRNGRVVFPARHVNNVYTGLSAVKALPSGKLLVSGYRYGRLFVARLTRDGRRDRSFGGGDGTVTYGVGDTEGCRVGCGPKSVLSVQRGGRILVLGSFWPTLLRLRRDGSLDPSFGRGGRVTKGLRRRLLLPSGIAIAGDGQMVVVGTASSNSDGCERHDRALGAMRFLPNGRSNRSFGSMGLLALPDACSSIGLAALPLPGGRVVAGGGLIRSVTRPVTPFSTETSTRYESFMLLTRFLSDR